MSIRDIIKQWDVLDDLFGNKEELYERAEEIEIDLDENEELENIPEGEFRVIKKVYRKKPKINNKKQVKDKSVREILKLLSKSSGKISLEMKLKISDKLEDILDEGYTNEDLAILSDAIYNKFFYDMEYDSIGEMNVESILEETPLEELLD